MTKKFADTSILLGFLDGQTGCVAARKDADWVTTHAHLLEVYSVLLGRPEVPSDQPADILRSLLPLTVQISDEAVPFAAEIRRKLRGQGKDCSYIDSLGYGVAQALGIPLLIADESFEGVHGASHIPIGPDRPRGTRDRSSRAGKS